MILPRLGSSLLFSFALVSPPLLAESDNVGAFLADARPGDRTEESSAAKEESPAPSKESNAASAAPAPAVPPKPKSPPPFLIPNRSPAPITETQSGGSETRPTPTPSRLRATPPPSIITGALRESFRYDASVHAPRANAESPDSSEVDDATSGLADSDVVMLPKMAVNERPLPRDLGADIARWHSKLPQNHTRFGTGIHEKDFGKVRVGVMTLFYIPIAVGASW